MLPYGPAMHLAELLPLSIYYDRKNAKAADQKETTSATRKIKNINPNTQYSTGQLCRQPTITER